MIKKHKMLEPAFTVAEVTNILNAKDHIVSKVSEFAMTIKKLGIGAEVDFFVSGGCTASLLQGEVPKDFDVYFIHKGICDEVVKLYKSESYKNEVATYNEKYRDVDFDDGSGEKLVITENAMTLKNGIQVIIKHHGIPDAVRRTFDFVHCLPYYSSVGNKFYISRGQYDCCVNKTLKINSGSIPALGRIEKFKKRGYTYGESQNTTTNTTNS